MDSYLLPLWISCKTVLVTTAITFVLGIAVARWMARYSGKYKGMIDGIFILPLVLPPTVVGFGLLMLFGKNGPLGEFLSLFDMTVVFSWPATVIAAVIMTFPLMYMSARAGFEQVDINIENAARTLGASEWRVFWTITMPAARPAIMAATVLAFARALGEFGATLMLAGNIPGKTTTIPVAIYFNIQAGHTDKAMVLVFIVLAISFVSLAALTYWKLKIPAKP
ncbi:MAG: molybdate ABC transporter permease subunit [Dehalococcoides mccartyi]|uniref:Molybdenum transport system permease n=1 Tax=Dehalococcoides mccartyi TaxID=61435 RepID=A0A0V8M050_9CHLR|nr:molybdate ABC transporter permease subunit [Dehalococcoides mccartyi]AQU03823.1 molybdenum ABC transporter permease subunit [Dehalococcoides mccartyi]AQU05121.1 molybdenum ABC transporter permease subunit [Dehalococcoides mccartyi]KSV17154.1 molybdate ABC transporter permease [Dehalococcoides mccartyi]MCF7635892.1 molybdenum ABC transporter permease subunit [Dehalococcoides mccartyi]MDN4186714.1 molybdate ABC transporter permease subunit [Dehalococcoides mccartyi]